MKTLVFAAILACVGTSVNAYAQAKEGVDFAEKTFRIKGDTTVQVNVKCTTINANSGNSTRIELFIDSSLVADSTVSKASHSLSRTVSSQGRHTVRLNCYNQLADAYEASIALVEEDIPTFGGN